MAKASDFDIIYTKVDEAPQLASASLLPIIQKFARAADVSVGVKDISLAGRILAAFPEHLSEAQRQSDDLAELGQQVKSAEAKVIKLPDYPEEPQTDAEKAVRAKYAAIKGSAVNPVLREGNSDRRAAKAVKNYAMANPHRMGVWEKSSKTKVSSMSGGDFRSNEKSTTVSAAQAGDARIEFTATDGAKTVLIEGFALPAGTVVDSTFLSVKALHAFLAEQIAATKADGTLFSLHLKATMMKVSDPIIFGHAVKAFLKPVFDKHGAALDAAGVNPNSGLGEVLARIAELPNAAEIEAEIAEVMADRPRLYMVNSDRGITNLHVPSDVIIDASIPAVIRAGGKGWGPSGEEDDTNCVIPDNSYAPVYDEAVNYFKETGALDPTTSGTVQNIGLMAQKAEEYGSHPTTFEMSGAGTVTLIAANGDVLHEHAVESGDIWRAASTKEAPIRDWVQLAMDRQKAEGCQAVFWLDETRARDAE